MNKKITTINTKFNKKDINCSTALDIEATEISHPVLRRLIEEVKNDKENNVTAYNRLHNRHNRTR